MSLTVKDIKQMPSGMVLHRVGLKKKYRVVKPRTLNTCDDCGATIKNNAVKLECSGNVTLFIMCPACSVLELE